MTEEHFDAIVVGSGFGGSVAAYRLAEAGRSVCLLERGKAYPPGSFPRSPYRMRENFWDPSARLHGLFNVWAFPGIAAVVASGLGGGSLIYANVLLRKDPSWFVHDALADGVLERWPVTYSDLEAHYDRVERMLQPVRYPLAEQTPKTRAFRRPNARGSTGRCPRSPSRSRTRAGRPAPASGYPAARTTCTAHHASPAAWSASATSAATSGRRTPSTSPTSRRPRTWVPTCALALRCDRSSPPQEADIAWDTSTTPLSRPAESP